MEFHIKAFVQHSLTDGAHESGFAHPWASFDYKDSGSIRTNHVMIEGIEALGGVPAREYVFENSFAHNMTSCFCGEPTYPLGSYPGRLVYAI